MTPYLTKRVGETRRYVFDWTGLEAGEAPAEDLGWMIVPQELGLEALQATGARFGAGCSSIELAGGKPGHVYHVSNRVRTSAGRAVSRAMMLRIAAA